MDSKNIQLTEEQQTILDNCDQNLFLNAGPGSGKSSLLSVIAEKLLKDLNNKVLLVTFSNKASKSIIAKCSGIDQKRILGGTFHGLANLFIRQNKLHWNICDEGKKRLIIKKLFDCKKDKNKLMEILDELSLAKCEWPLKLTNNIIKYNTELVKYDLTDFDDMIYKIIDLLPSLTLSKISHILVDELQDTNSPQLEMLKVLYSKLNCKIIGCGDLDQEIYSFRGACFENIERFISYFNCKIYNMGINFRSSTKIVECSRNLIEHNKKRINKTIRAFKTDMGVVSDYQCKNPLNEIAYVIAKCKQNPKSEIAILYRNRSFKNHLEFELKKANLKYCVNDSLEISDRSSIKVMIACMKLAAKIGDIFDLEIASKGLKGIGKAFITNIKKEISSDKSLSDVLIDKFHDPKNHKKLNSLISIVSYFNNHEGLCLTLLAGFIEKFFIKSFDYQEDMKNFINDITKDYRIKASEIRDISNDLGLDGKEENQDKDALIELSTVHGWKGMQAPIVILPWCQMFEPQASKEYNIEDERRLFYVGITRPEFKLFLSYSGLLPRFIREMDI